MGLRLFATALFALQLTSCSSGESGGQAGAGAAGAALGHPCDDESSCAEGLHCAMGGDIAGICTAECTATSICEARYGAKTVCSGGLCRRTCTVFGGQSSSAGGPLSPTYANHLECPTERCAIVTSSYGLCGWTL